MLNSEGKLFALFLCDIKGNRVNDRNRFTLLMSISDCLSGSAGTSIPNCDQNIRLINHITVTLVHAVRRVMGLNQCFLIALGSNVKIPISQGFRPLCGLAFAWDGAFKRNSQIGAFSPSTISAAYISTPIAIPDIKCVTPSFSMRLMICSLRVFLRSMQRSSSSLKPNGRFCGRCPVKAQVFIFFFIS